MKVFEDWEQPVLKASSLYFIDPKQEGAQEAKEYWITDLSLYFIMCKVTTKIL